VAAAAAVARRGPDFRMDREGSGREWKKILETRLVAFVSSLLDFLLLSFLFPLWRGKKGATSPATWKGDISLSLTLLHNRRLEE
jgi:hypothetical protein